MKRIAGWIVLALALWALTGAALAEQWGTAVIDGKTADRVHLRQEADVDSLSMGLYFTGTTVQCLSDPSEAWVQVTIGSQTGYIMGEYLSRDAVTSRQPAATVAQSSGWVNLRQTPSLQAAVLKQCYAGQSTFTVMGETASQWYYVSIDGILGYVKEEYLQLGTASAPSGTAGEAYQAVLRGERGFFRAETNDAELIGDQTPGYTQFAVLDMDGDGTAEVVLQSNVGLLVLYERNGIVFGFNFAYRAMLQLKADGTFSFASSAAENGFARLSFSGAAYTILQQTYSEVADTMGTIVYYVDQRQATEEAFQQAIAQQEAKQDAVWYDLTDSNIQTWLSGK